MNECLHNCPLPFSLEVTTGAVETVEAQRPELNPQGAPGLSQEVLSDWSHYRQGVGIASREGQHVQSQMEARHSLC